MADGLGQGLRRPRGDHYPALGPGDVLVNRDIVGPFEPHHIRLVRSHRQLFGFIGADEGPLRAHGLLVGRWQIDDALHPRQMLRQGFADRTFFGLHGGGVLCR